MTTSRRTTVLHIFSGDLWAGAEVAVFNLLNQLRHRPELALIALALNEGTLTHRLRALGLETHVVPETGVSLAKLFAGAYGRLRGKPIDIIHSHRYKENLLAVLLAKPLAARSLVSTVHGLSDPPAHDSVAAGRARPKTRLDYFVLRHCFDRVVAVSAEIKRILMRAHRFRESRVAVIHNGVPLADAVPSAALRSAPVQIGSVGRLDPIKRFDLLLDVAALVRAETDGVRFSILGDGPLRAELIDKCRARKLDDRVEFLAACPDPLAYYRSLDIYLNTSLHEGLPLSLLEAMACGRPVIAPRVGGIPEIVVHGAQGLLVESSEPQDFARACITLVTDRRRRGAMGESARRRVAACFRDTQMADAYRHLYLKLAEHSARTAFGSARRRLTAAAQG